MIPKFIPQICVPGQPLAPLSKFIPGSGVHISNNAIIASRVGFPSILGKPKSESGVLEKQTLSILDRKLKSRDEQEGSKEEEGSGVMGGKLPSVGSTVLARVKRINLQQAVLGIFAVDGVVGDDEFQGVIRQVDVRLSEKDKVRIPSCFRPGDIVRAVVISLGDQSNYYLSTASNDLGVVVARGASGYGEEEDGEGGEQMVPVSWKEMRGVVTGRIEERKVAKPI